MCCLGSPPVQQHIFTVQHWAGAPDASRPQAITGIFVFFGAFSRITEKPTIKLIIIILEKIFVYS